MGMGMPTGPSLPEELLLLALHDEKGSVIPAAASVLNGALIGAVLMELGILGCLRSRRDARDHEVLIADRTSTGDDILDDALQAIAEAHEPRLASYWVGRLARQMPDLKDRYVDRLVARGVLERRERRILWVFPSRSFPLVDRAVEQQARDRVRAVVLEGRTPDSRTAALIGLVRAANLTDELFAPHERAQAHERIVELTSQEAVGHGGLLGAGLQGVLLGLVLGATIFYAHQMLNQPATADSDWDFGDTTAWSSDDWSDGGSSGGSDGGWGGDSGGDSGGGGDGGGGGGGD